MNNYQISHILPANEALLYHDVYLALVYATHIPPHLALVVNGKYFALSVKGPEVNQDLAVVIRTIRKKKIPSLFIALKTPQVLTMEQLNAILKKITLSYPKLDVGVATCLSPIKDFCNSVFETETRNVNFIFDLLPRLREQEVISGCYHFYLDQFLKQDVLELHKYTMEEINAGIRKSMNVVLA